MLRGARSSTPSINEGHGLEPLSRIASPIKKPSTDKTLTAENLVRNNIYILKNLNAHLPEEVGVLKNRLLKPREPPTTKRDIFGEGLDSQKRSAESYWQEYYENGIREVWQRHNFCPKWNTRGELLIQRQPRFLLSSQIREFQPEQEFCLSAPWPDICISFPLERDLTWGDVSKIYTVQNIESHFHYKKLAILEENDLICNPIKLISESAYPLHDTAKEVPCFPWMIAEIKHHQNKGRKDDDEYASSKFCYRQLANGTSVCLDLFLALSTFKGRNTDYVPPVVGLSLLGDKVSIWLTYSCHCVSMLPASPIHCCGPNWNGENPPLDEEDISRPHKVCSNSSDNIFDV
jgi:hypothetical protein